MALDGVGGTQLVGGDTIRHADLRVARGVEADAGGGSLEQALPQRTVLPRQAGVRWLGGGGAAIQKKCVQGVAGSLGPLGGAQQGKAGILAWAQTQEQQRYGDTFHH